MTIHLQNGQTHSCHHPGTHKVEFRELAENPTALHNTVWKKYQRYNMLQGERPSECDYCWKIEDAHPDNISDRTLKSSEDWALPNMDEALTKPWDYDFQPRYVEVSFSHACNFKCMYCAPHISSSIMNEYLEYGHYNESPGLSLENLKTSGLMPIGRDDHNPYVDAFWKWWPTLIEKLEYFRISGGEPLVNPNTFRFLEFLNQNPLPNLSFAINSNLGISDATYDRFLNSIKSVLENKYVKNFDFFTSVDTHGPQAEYIRFGLDYKNYMNNVRKFLDVLPQDTKLIFMCTFNALSVPTFRAFLEDVIVLKRTYKTSRGDPRVILDIPYLRNPSYLSLSILTKNFELVLDSDLAFMTQHSQPQHDGSFIFTDYEVAKMERVINWFKSIPENSTRNNQRRAFYSFIKEYDRRKGLDFFTTFPTLVNFYKECERMYLENTDV